MATRYQEYATRALALAAADTAFVAYRTRLNNARGLPTDTSLDRQAGAVRNPPITTRAVNVLVLNGLFIIESPDDDNVNAGAIATVDRASLRQAVRDALDQRDAAIPFP